MEGTFAGVTENSQNLLASAGDPTLAEREPTGQSSGPLLWVSHWLTQGLSTIRVGV